MSSSRINQLLLPAAIITAAGKSTRFGKNIKKEFQLLESGTVLSKTVSAFYACPEINPIIVTLPYELIESGKKLLSFDYDPSRLLFVEGGKTRQESVYNALCALSSEDITHVFIHDGARPWVTSDLIDITLESAEKNGAGVPVIPSVDTLKRVSSEGFITDHLNRAEIFGVQTPQCFLFKSIISAHKKALKTKKTYTDDSEIYSDFIGPVSTVPGDPKNIKITYKEDLL